MDPVSRRPVTDRPLPAIVGVILYVAGIGTAIVVSSAYSACANVMMHRGAP